jgi:hypothetical protein
MPNRFAIGLRNLRREGGDREKLSGRLWIPEKEVELYHTQ